MAGGPALSAEGHQVKPTGFLGNGGPAEEMVIPKAVIHRKGIRDPVCACACVYDDVIPSVPRLSVAESLGTDVLLSAAWVVICRGAEPLSEWQVPSCLPHSGDGHIVVVCWQRPPLWVC